MTNPPGAGDIRNAANRIRGVAKRTPVMTSRSLNERAGRECFVKCENLQTGGSFKIRGAYNFARSIPEAERPKGVVAFSSGNHAQAVAIAAQALKMTATIIMPQDAPQSKLQATRDKGANVITYDRFTEDREAIGRRIAAETGATLIPPFDHPWIIAGQGTLALELLEEVPDLDALLICCGGGGLISGCAIAAKAVNPKIRVFGAEPELANDTHLSLKKGERVTVDASRTIADGLRTPSPSELTFSIIQQHVEDVLLVSESQLERAVNAYLTLQKTSNMETF